MPEAYPPPLVIFIASTAAYSLAAAQTSRDSLLRYGILGFLALCAYSMPYSLVSFSSSTGTLTHTASGAICWNVVAYSHRLILRGWDYYHYGPVITASSQSKPSLKSPSPSGSKPHYPGTRMDFGSEVTGNARGIGLFWQIKNVPFFSKLEPDYVPSRSVFIVVQSAAAVLCYLLHRAAVLTIVNLDRHYQQDKFAPFFSRLSEVTLPELKVRTLSSMGHWVKIYTMLQLLYSVSAIIAGISNPDSIKLWPPHFGPLSSAYTLRNFWGKFWHQTLRFDLEGWSNFLAHAALELPRRGILQRYFKIFLCFGISGAMHVVADMSSGMRPRDSKAMTFFIMQAIGITVEDVVHAVYRRYLQRGSRPTLVERIIGYAWVLAFLIWTSPPWQFPTQRVIRKEDDLLGFSAIRPLVFGRRK